jgi:hypothetical protein
VTVDDPHDLRLQAEAWRRQARRHDRDVAQALERAATILEERAVGIETARSHGSSKRSGGSRRPIDQG